MLKILYIDMDNVMVDFESGLNKIFNVRPEFRKIYEGRYDEIPSLFSLMDPMPGALDAYHILNEHYDTYLLSTAPWENPSAWSDKLHWVKEYVPAAYKRLILSHHKNLNSGDYLIDDRTKNGVEFFQGEHIHFGTERFPDWEAVLEYII